MLGFLSPARGTVTFNGCSMAPQEIKKLWPDIAYVKQDIFLLHDSLRNNILLGDPAPDEERLNQAVAAAGLESVICALTNGLENIIVENGKNLSGGQRQRIALARAFYRDAGLMVFDEPFNELDIESEKMLLVHLQTLAAKGKIIVLISHQKESLSFCNKIIRLDG
jgi:ABC-type bacteriocin/lantibiotic exporter with double-glycine peptidase domain